MEITGDYNFKIIKDGDYYIAKGKTPDGKGTLLTQGKTREEIFDMVANSYMCLSRIEISWWNKLLGKLRIYR